MKKILGILLVACMLLGAVTGLADGYTAGTYTAAAKGNNGDVTVSVTFSETAITAIEVTEHAETALIGDKAIESLPGKIVEEQSLAIDVIAGVTNTSKAILTAVEDCVAQAGGDPAALKVKADAAVAEDAVYETQILVVGAGYAGLAAANSAAMEGAEVILIEKLSLIGGTSALSGGEMLSDGKVEGIPAMKEYWVSRQQGFPAADKMNVEKVHYYLDELVPTLDWMANEFGMMYSDNLKTNPVRRPCGLEARGASVAAILNDGLVRNGVTLMLDTTATELITDENNVVTGVVATGKNGETITFKAQAVILATGGFTQNAELMQQYAPEFAGFINTTAAGDDGDGLLMAQKLGAYVFDDSLAVNNYGAYKQDGTTMRATASACLFVGMDGQRKTDEAEDRYYVSTAFLYTPEGPDFFSITDEQNAINNGLLEAIEANMNEPTVFKADTLEDLAAQMGIDVETFMATVNRYNELCAAGVDEDFGKKAEFMVPVANGPFYAVRNTEVLYSVMGGLKTDNNGAVLDTEGKAISGLYAAGAVCARDLYGKLYIGASMVPTSLSMGRLTGAHVAGLVK